MMVVKTKKRGTIRGVRAYKERERKTARLNEFLWLVR